MSNEKRETKYFIGIGSYADEPEKPLFIYDHNHDKFVRNTKSIFSKPRPELFFETLGSAESKYKYQELENVGARICSLTIVITETKTWSKATRLAF